jgi:hypothetical protein
MNFLHTNINAKINNPVAVLMSKGRFCPSKFKSDLSNPEHRKRATTSEKVFDKFKT